MELKEVDIELIDSMAKNMQKELSTIVQRYYDQLPYEKYEVWFNINDFMYMPRVTAMINKDHIIVKAISESLSA